MVPFECLKIAPKQRYQKKLNDQQLATLIRSAARPADERQREIEDWVAKANVNADPVSSFYTLYVVYYIYNIKLLGLLFVETISRIKYNEACRNKLFI